MYTDNRQYRQYTIIANPENGKTLTTIIAEQIYQ